MLWRWTIVVGLVAMAIIAVLPWNDDEFEDLLGEWIDLNDLRK